MLLNKRPIVNKGKHSEFAVFDIVSNVSIKMGPVGPMNVKCFVQMTVKGAYVIKSRPASGTVDAILKHLIGLSDHVIKQRIEIYHH